MEPPGRPRRADRGLTTGWRYWQLAAGSDRLSSVSQRRVEWEPGRPLRAFCLGREHPSPADRCNCGIYAAFDLETLRRNSLCLAPEGLVAGEVELWGRLAVSDEGYRGEYAYPLSLAFVEETVGSDSIDRVLEALGAYGVPVTTMSLDQAAGDVARSVIAHQAMSSRPCPPR